MQLARTPASPGGYQGNLLLDALPEKDRTRLLAQSRVEDLPVRHVLFEPDVLLTTVHFPLSGMVSLVTRMDDGSGVEAATVGREGIVGVPAVLDGRSFTNSHGVAQIQGRALAVDVNLFRTELARGGRLLFLVNGYLQALFTLLSQNAACNRLHPVRERCARWLLMTHDRVDGDKFDLTQEFLAQMLGTRRASVSEVAEELQRTDAIRYQRGRITISDRPRLEGLTCECYFNIRLAFQKLYRD